MCQMWAPNDAEMSLTYEQADEPKIISTFVAGRYNEKENLQKKTLARPCGIYQCAYALSPPKSPC